MKKSKAEILEAIKKKLGEDSSDEAIALIEDVTDTLDDYDAQTKDSTDWKRRFEENDAEWRKKYKDRFFESGTEDSDKIEKKNGGKSKEDDEEDKTPKTFEDLFKEGEKK